MSVPQVSHLFNGPFLFKLVLCRYRTLVTHLSLKCRLSRVSWIPRALELGSSVGEPLAQEEHLHLLPSLCSNISGNFRFKASRSILCPVYLLAEYLLAWSINSLSALSLKQLSQKLKHIYYLLCFPISLVLIFGIAVCYYDFLERVIGIVMQTASKSK